MQPGEGQARDQSTCASTELHSNDNQPPVSVTTEDFLQAIFGLNWRDTWVCAFGPGPENWAGRRFIPDYIRDESNNYFCIGTLDGSADRRASDAVVSHHLVFADDIGTKVDPEKWEALFVMGFPKPTFRIETSPGNQTWIWVLRHVIGRDDVEEVRALRAVREAFARLGLSDPLKDDARYIRLPSGINSKQKYLDQFGGIAPAVTLVEWNRGATSDLEQMATILLGSDWRDKPDDVLGIKGGASFAGALQRTADLNDPEPIIQLAIELGMKCEQVRAGVVEAECPNIAAHTTRADTGFAFLGQGLMECSHASCQHLRTPDFARMICDAYDARQEGKAALGLMRPDEPKTADEFLARAAFQYGDAKSGVTAADLAAQAQRMVLAHNNLPSGFALTPETLLTSAAAIPPRQWLYGRQLIRGHVSLLVSPGGLGKSSVVIVDGVAMVIGRPLLGDKPIRPLNVWIWNGEDPPDELKRRLAAVAKKYNITAADLLGRLYLTSGREVPIKIVQAGRDGVSVAQPVVDWVVEMLKSAGVDVLIVDPFVTTHNAPENDNTAMNTAIAAWREVADRAGCAVLLVHHVSKAAALDGDAQGIYGSRGGGAIIDGVRSARFLVRMTKEEAARFGIPDSERWRYFRVQDGKSNLAPAGEAVWMRMDSVPLCNGAGDWPDGDVVGVVETWTPPKATDILTAADLRRVQDAIANAPEAPRADERANGWVGYLVADVMYVDIGNPGDRKTDRTPDQNTGRAQVRQWIASWLADGSLVRERVTRTRDGRPTPVISVGRRAPEDASVETGAPAKTTSEAAADAD